MSTLNEIEKATKSYAEAGDNLAQIQEELDVELDKIVRNFLPRIKRAAAAVAEKESTLESLIEDSKELFVKPKTISLFGIKVGFQKSKNKIDWDDDQLVVKLIRKHLPEIAETLIITNEKPSKAALQNLEEKDLKKIGIWTEHGEDRVFIKAAASAIEKIVRKFVQEKRESLEKAA